MMLPIIGIVPSRQKELSEYFLSKKYSDAVIEAGGIPYMLSYSSDKEIISGYIDSIDGLLLSGGIDPDTVYYKEEPLPGMGAIDPLRDKFEIDLINEALNNNIPILGICRGCQILNIAAGGTLIQDLDKSEEYLKHNQNAPRWYPTHDIIIKDGSILYNIFAKKVIRVNSFHHQAIKDTGSGFFVTAWSRDNIVEAIEKEGKNFVLGVQFHPEAMWERNRAFLGIFREFIKRATV
jgi:putative glutamine amidotransferase